MFHHPDPDRRQRPHRFIIDTGAQRTIISRELAKMLALPAHDRVKIVSIGGMADVDGQHRQSDLWQQQRLRHSRAGAAGK